MLNAILGLFGVQLLSIYPFFGGAHVARRRPLDDGLDAKFAEAWLAGLLGVFCS